MGDVKTYEEYRVLFHCFWRTLPSAFSIIVKLFGTAFTNLSHKRQAKVPIITIYSMIIYLSACPLPTFQCYHCSVNCPKATICHSPKTTQPSQTFIGNSCSTIECNLQNDILRSWNLSFTSHDKSFLWKWFRLHCTVAEAQGQILLASWGHLALPADSFCLWWDSLQWPSTASFGKIKIELYWQGCIKTVYL